MNNVSDGDKIRLRGNGGRTTPFTVEIVVTPEAIMKGLSGREQLISGEGMMFIFPEISKQSMWMPEMKFPLDIIWLNEDLTVVHITYNCKPCKSRSDCRSYSSEFQVKYAIEFKAGDADNYGFAIGTSLHSV
jgi:uncharacterized membrane protein (UPF0127 family)